MKMLSNNKVEFKKELLIKKKHVFQYLLCITVSCHSRKLLVVNSLVPKRKFLPQEIAGDAVNSDSILF